MNAPLLWQGDNQDRNFAAPDNPAGGVANNGILNRQAVSVLADHEHVINAAMSFCKYIFQGIAPIDLYFVGKRWLAGCATQ